MGLGDSLRPADGGGWIPLLYGPLGCGGDAVRSGGAVPDDPGRGFHRVRVSVRTVLDVKLNNKNPRAQADYLVEEVAHRDALKAVHGSHDSWEETQ